MISMQTSDRLEGIGEYYFARKLREIDALNREGRKVINLGIGSPDLPPHDDVIRALSDESVKPQHHGYQNYKGSPLLRKAIAAFYTNWYGVSLNPETEILPLIGSKEGIMHICMTYLNTGDSVLVPDPGYPTYSSAVRLAGGTCLQYDLREKNNWEPDFAAIKATGLQGVKLLWLNYPNMPTGKLPTKELFEKAVAFGREHSILICHDNPYSFILNDDPMSILSVAGAKDVAIELNSLSKSSNMAGWRVGWLAGAQARIDDVMRFKSNMDSGMFLPLQMAAVKALELGRDWYEALNRTYDIRRRLVYTLLDQLGCRYDKKQAGLFVWASIPPTYADSYALSDDILARCRVFLTPGAIFGSNGRSYVRVSLCQKEEVLNEALERLGEQGTAQLQF